MRTIVLFTFLLTSICAFSQMHDPTSWKYTTKELANNEVELIFDVQITEPWHMYGSDFEDDGPMKLKFNFTKSDKYELAGKVIPITKAHKEFDKIFEMNIEYYSSHAQFKQKIKVKSNEDFSVTGDLEYQVCDEGKCVVFFPDFKFNVKTSEPKKKKRFFGEK